MGPVNSASGRTTLSMEPDMKKWYTSKTIWTNLIALAASLLAAFGIADLDAELQASMVATVMAVTNIVLRLVTKEPIGNGDNAG